jgi:hypothetical protein
MAMPISNSTVHRERRGQERLLKKEKEGEGKEELCLCISRGI